MHDTDSYIALKEVFKFNEADIAANQNGVISPSQKQHIEKKHYEDSQNTWLFLLFCAVIGFGGSALAAWNEGIPLLQMWGGVAVAMLALTIFARAIIIRQRIRMRRTLEEHIMQEVRGSIWLISESSKPRRYYFQVGRQKFEITWLQYLRLNNTDLVGQQAVVYYAAHWRGVLSVQRLS